MRPIIDLLVRNIWWVRAPHHIAIVGILRTWGDGREDTAGVGRPTRLCAKVREVGQDVGKVI